MADIAPLKVNMELQDEVKKALKADGYFIMITRKEGNKLFHRQFMVGYNILDCFLSILGQWGVIESKHHDLIKQVKKRQKTGGEVFGFLEKLASKIKG